MAGTNKLTAPNSAPVVVENVQQTGSNPAASQAPVQATDDDGWTVTSASVGSMAPASVEDLKARAETVTVDDQAGRRDVRPGSKDSLNPDPPKPAETPKPDEPARGPDGKFATPTAEEIAAAAAAPAPTAEETAAAAAAKPDRLPGESRKDYRARVRHAKIQGKYDDETYRREALKRENDALDAEIAEKRRRAADPDAGRAPAPDPNAPKPLPPADEDQKPTWKAYQADGKSWDDYTEDRDAWQDRELLRFKQDVVQDTRRRTTSDAVVQSRAQAFTGRVEQARAAHADYDAVVAGLTMENTPFIANLVANSDHGAELLYYLGQHTDLAADLAELTPPASLAGGRVGVHPSQAAILEALRTSPDPAALLTKLLDPASEHFERISGLTGAQAFREIMKLEGAPAPVPAAPAAPGRPRAEPKKTAAPPLRPPSGAAVPGAESRGAQTVEDLPFGPEYVRAANEEDRRRGRRF